MFAQFGGLNVYRKQLAAYPGEFCEKAERVNTGARVLLPSSCLAELSTMNVAYPLQFRIQSPAGVCFAGVLEFNAENGVVIMPEWMFSMLMLNPGDTVALETCVLPPGKLIKLRPQQSSFIELSDPKRILEQHLSEYPVLTRGTSIVLRYLDHDFIIDVTEITDELDNNVAAISTVRADALATELKVEFERPLDMPPSPVNNEETEASPGRSNVIGSGEPLDFNPVLMKPPSIVKEKEAKAAEAKEEKPSFVPFTGGGRCISDRPAPRTAAAAPASSGAGSAPRLTPEEVREKRFQAFAGAGRSLR